MKQPRSSWAVLSIILIGTLVGTLGNSMANIAVPAIMTEFSISLSSAVWVVTLYTLVFSVLAPVCGDLGSRVGQRRLYLMGISLVILALIGCGLAPSFPLLLGSRLLQGIGIAPILPAVMVLIARTFAPDQRGRAMGYWALVNGAGHAFGPPVSGFLIQYLSWRAVFLLTVPLCLVNLYFVWRLIPVDKEREKRSFDLKGAGSLTLGALSMMLALNQSSRLGWTSPYSLSLWGVALLGMLAFVFVERRVKQPLVDLALFANHRYTAAILVICAESFSLFGLLLAVPIYLIRAQGWQSQQAGLFVLALTLTMALVAPLAGRLADARGSRLPCLLGAGMIGLGALVVVSLQPEPGQALLRGSLLAGLLLIGAGMGLVQSPVTTAAIQVVPGIQVGVASGIFHMSRFVLGALGSTVFGLILETNRSGISAGFYQSLWVVVAAAAVALLASRILPARTYALYDLKNV